MRASQDRVAKGTAAKGTKQSVNDLRSAMHHYYQAEGSKGGLKKARKSTAERKDIFEDKQGESRVKQDRRSRAEALEGTGSREDLGLGRGGIRAPTFSVEDEVGDDFKENVM